MATSSHSTHSTATAVKPRSQGRRALLQMAVATSAALAGAGALRGRQAGAVSEAIMTNVETTADDRTTLKAALDTKAVFQVQNTSGTASARMALYAQVGAPASPRSPSRLGLPKGK